MMMSTLLIAAALAFGQGEATGSDTAQPAATARPADMTPAAPANITASTAGEDEKRVCRKERRTGTNLTTRICRTESERRKDADAARDMLRNGQSINNLDTGAQ
jgi:hypothetical protein